MKNQEESILIVAGEKSGEEHCLTFFSKLISLTSCIPNKGVKFFGIGSSVLQDQGLELIYDMKDFSVMGLSEILFKLPFFLKALNRIEDEVVRRGCKSAILIDFQDFNMELAKRLKKRNVRVFYIVAPQAWAWKSFRAAYVKNRLEKLYAILPFEKKWFSDRGANNVVSIKHPLVDRYSDYFTLLDDHKYHQSKIDGLFLDKKINLSILPGSRRSEIKSLFPIFVETYENLKKKYAPKGYSICSTLVMAENIDQSVYGSWLDKVDKKVFSKDLPSVLIDSNIALAASGTVTLICGVFQVPTVVCYKTSFLNEFVFESLVGYEGPFSLTNLIAQKMIFPEVLQERVRSEVLLDYLVKWVENREDAKKEYENVLLESRKIRSKLHGDSISLSDDLYKELFKEMDSSHGTPIK